MVIKKSSEVEKKEVKTEGASKVFIRWLIGPDSAAPNFFMRLFEVEPGGHTPYHQHANEHEVFIIEGCGRIRTEKGPVEVAAGSFALVLSGEMHCFENAGDTPFRFLCMIPRQDQ